MIDVSTNIRAALKKRQRGFLLNPFRFGGGAPAPTTSVVAASFVGFVTSSATGFSFPTVADGDTSFVVMFARDTITPASGYTLVDSVSITGLGVTQTLYVYRKTLTDAGDSGKLQTFTQATAQRMALAQIRVRNSDGSNCVALTHDTGTYTASGLPSGLHPVPTVISPRDGLVCIIASSCIYGSNSAYDAPVGGGYTAVTPTAAVLDNRMEVAYRAVGNGYSTSGLTCGHAGADHFGVEFALIVGASGY